jgi:hypothetical protein
MGIVRMFFPVAFQGSQIIGIPELSSPLLEMGPIGFSVFPAELALQIVS